MKRIQLFLAALMLLPCFGLATGSAQAFDFFPKCNTAEAKKSITCKEAAKQQTTNPVAKTLRTVSNVVAIAAGVIAVIMIIISGIQMIISGGNSDQAAQGRRTIFAAVAGLVVVAVAWTLVRFITDNVLK